MSNTSDSQAGFLGAKARRRKDGSRYGRLRAALGAPASMHGTERRARSARLDEAEARAGGAQGRARRRRTRGGRRNKKR